MNNYKKTLEDTKADLDGISESFCVAKWKQVTIHLQNGMNHSCHHPQAHVVPVEEVLRNYRAIHNSEYKKQQRKMMIEGDRPDECDYCWRVEDTDGQSYSDRIHKSATQWARPYITDIVTKPWDHDVDPSYVEVSFSNVCNFKCSYCSPAISSKWMEEIEQYGPYPTSYPHNGIQWLKDNNQMPIPNREQNVYVEAFWRWWPTMYTSLRHFRVTGGEPLLAKDTFKILDYVIENPNTDLELSINSNLNPVPELFDKFIDKVKIIVQQNKVRKFTVFTSAEAYGAQCEYIRSGMDYNQWLNNIERLYKEVPGINITIMSTYNLLSIPTYTKFLGDILAVKQRWLDSPTSNRLLLDIPYMRHPFHQTIFLATPEMTSTIKDQIAYMKANASTAATIGFQQHEIDKLTRVYEVATQSPPDSEQTKNRRDFIIFVDEHDRRRGTNFLETFPEFTDIYAEWSRL